MLTFKQHIQNSKVFHEGKEQGLTLAHETALNQRGIISHVGDNLGCVEYNIVQGFSWADVDRSLRKSANQLIALAARRGKC